MRSACSTTVTGSQIPPRDLVFRLRLHVRRAPHRTSAGRTIRYVLYDSLPCTCTRTARARQTKKTCVGIPRRYIQILPRIANYLGFMKAFRLRDMWNISPVVLVEAEQSKTQQEVSSFTLKTTLNSTVSSRSLLSLISRTSSLRGAMAASKKGYWIANISKTVDRTKLRHAPCFSVPSSTTYQILIFARTSPLKKNGNHDSGSTTSTLTVLLDLSIVRLPSLHKTSRETPKSKSVHLAAVWGLRHITWNAKHQPSQNENYSLFRKNWPADRWVSLRMRFTTLESDWVATRPEVLR